jgi:hypothetical protein
MEKKGVLVFLAVTFGLGYALQIGLLAAGLISLAEPSLVQNVVAALVLFVPALGVLIATQAAPNAGPALPPTWPVPTGAALRLSLLALVGFGASYALSAVMGWNEAQAGMGTLVNQLDEFSKQFQLPPLTDQVRAMIPVVALTAGPLLSLALGATVFAALAWGGEIGWRGYLLPRLAPLGWLPAHLIVGLLWAAWFLPLIVSWHGSVTDPALYAFVARFLVFGAVFGVVAGEVMRASQHLGLVAIFVGGFAAQLFGIWEFLFQFSTPPWTGPFGIVAIACWALIAAVAGPIARVRASAPK